MCPEFGFNYLPKGFYFFFELHMASIPFGLLEQS